MAEQKRRQKPGGDCTTPRSSQSKSQPVAPKGRHEPIMHPDAYWSLVSIARVIEFSVHQARKIVCQPDFPGPTRFVENGYPRWKAGDVMKWLDERGPNHYR